MKKILFLFLMSTAFLSQTKAASLPGSRFRVYDSVKSYGETSTIVNLQTNETWSAAKNMIVYYMNGSQLTAFAQGWPSKVIMTAGYDSILNGAGTSITTVSGLQTYLQPHKLQSVDQPAQDSTGKVYATGIYDIYQWDIINVNALAVYVKLYDASTVPTSKSTPILVLLVPAGGTVFNGNSGASCKHVNTGIAFRATNAIGYTDSSEPVSNIYISVRYR